MKIQPIISWQNGEELQGTDFTLNISSDNLATEATFYYNIRTAEVSHTETVVVTPEVPAWDETLPDGEIVHHDAIPAVTQEVTIIDTYSQILVQGYLNLDGQEYQDWDSDPSANQWAYNWAVVKLNLTPIPNQIIA
jgi:hypothetical protein